MDKEQEEMDKFIEQELPEELEFYNKFIKKEKPYPHTVRNFIILFFFPI